MADIPQVPASLAPYEYVLESLKGFSDYKFRLPNSSYVEDPKWQIKFTIVWVSVLGAFVLKASPRLWTRIRNGSIFNGILGMNWNARTYERLAELPDAEVDELTSERVVKRNRGAAFLNTLQSFIWWTPPIVGLNAGQIFLVCAYLAFLAVCFVCGVSLINNPNRASFMAIAQLPPVFIFATKNSIVSLLLGPGAGYERLNFIHRWAGRGLYLGTLLHGSLWLSNYLYYGLPILGQQKTVSGIACFSVLSIIVLTSLRPVRRYLWNVFWIVHLLCYVAFFVTVCYHTLFAYPWIYPPLAFYGLDLLMRMIKSRIEDAVLVPVDQQMTLVHIPFKTSGWKAGQFVRLRVFFRGRFLESHPFTIMCAPPMEGCLARSLDDKAESIDSSPEIAGYTGTGLVLGVRAAGDWTKALNGFACNQGQRISDNLKNQHAAAAENAPTPVPVYVMVDGPYGGCSVDPSAFETVLFVSGGSGATFTIGLLDELVGKCLKRTCQVVTRKIEVVWYIRSVGAIRWFASFLNTIAHQAAACQDLDLHMTIYVTCLCNPDAVVEIPNCDVLLARPRVGEVIKRVVDGSPDPATQAEEGDLDIEKTADKLEEMSGESGSCETHTLGPAAAGGGLAVCASGPQDLASEAANAVAALSASRKGRELGSIALHTEVYAV